MSILSNSQTIKTNTLGTLNMLGKILLHVMISIHVHIHASVNVLMQTESCTCILVLVLVVVTLLQDGYLHQYHYGFI